jgi:hypothetical protein
MPSDPEIEALRQRLDALVNDASKVEAAAAHRHVQAARLLLEEQATDDDLERKAATANGLLPSSFSSATTSDMVDGATNDSTLVTNLHTQATAIPNVRQLVNIVLDTTSTNYAIWHDPDFLLVYGPSGPDSP